MHKEQVDGCKTKALRFLTMSPLPALPSGPATSDGSCLIVRVCQRAQLIQKICCSQTFLIWGPCSGLFHSGWIQDPLIPTATALTYTSTVRLSQG